MEVLKTTVGHHILNWFPENVAFDIASFLAEDPEENRRKQQYKLMVSQIYANTKKGKKISLTDIART